MKADILDHIRVSLICVLLTVSAPAAADSPGSTGAEFLKIGVGPRAMALGSAYTAVADDAYSLYWNPAGLARIKHGKAEFQVNSYFQDIDQHYLAVGYRYKKIGVFGIGLNALQATDIPRTTVSGAGVVSTVGSFDARDMSLSIGFARELTGWMSAGGTLKWISSSIADYDADAWAVDAGIQVTPLSFLSLGFTLQNLGTGVEFISTRDPLPFLYRFGAAGYIFKNRSLILTMDMTQAKNDLLYFGFGCEYSLTLMRNRYAFRAGYTTANTDSDRGITLGFGLYFARFMGFEYAFVPFGVLGDAHRYSLSLTF